MWMKIRATDLETVQIQIFEHSFELLMATKGRKKPNYWEVSETRGLN